MLVCFWQGWAAMQRSEHFCQTAGSDCGVEAIGDMWGCCRDKKILLMLNFWGRAEEQRKQCHMIPTPLLMHWRGGIPPALKLFQCIIAVICVAFFVCVVPNFIVCLVVSSLYV